MARACSKHRADENAFPSENLKETNRLGDRRKRKNNLNTGVEERGIVRS
jgi:hypothetical protein